MDDGVVLGYANSHNFDYNIFQHQHISLSYLKEKFYGYFEHHRCTMVPTIDVEYIEVCKEAL